MDHSSTIFNWYWSWYRTHDISIFDFCKISYQYFTIHVFSNWYAIFDLLTSPATHQSVQNFDIIKSQGYSRTTANTAFSPADHCLVYSSFIFTCYTIITIILKLSEEIYTEDLFIRWGKLFTNNSPSKTIMSCKQK